MTSPEWSWNVRLYRARTEEDPAFNPSDWRDWGCEEYVYEHEWWSFFPHDDLDSQIRHYAETWFNASAEETDVFAENDTTWVYYGKPDVDGISPHKIEFQDFTKYPKGRQYGDPQ